ncbi:MAG: C4-dicarboxylate ABC transporter substrate-binding protein, partial [Pseudomonadota bacterium]
DIVKYANFPGFHSMPSDHLACNKSVWDGMPDHHKRIMEVAMEKLALRQAMQAEKANNEAAAELRAKGVTLYDWSAEDRATFRQAAQETWPEFATTPEAKALVESHTNFLKGLGLID